MVILDLTAAATAAAVECKNVELQVAVICQVDT